MTSSITTTLGVGSGIDITALVDNLTQADRAPKDAALKRREDSNTAKVSALAEAANGIEIFASSLSRLVSGGSLFTQPTVSDPTILSATAVAGTRLSSLSAQIEVVQLAKAQTLESVSLASASAPVGQGDLTLVTAAGSFTVTIDGSNDSLSGLAAAINGKNAGITASVVTDSNGARLMLKGGTGAAAAFTLSVPGGTSSGLERFAFGASVTGGLTQAQAAQDAIVRLDGVEVHRSSNSFSDLIQGVQIDLKRASPGSILSLGIARPGAAIEQAVDDFVGAYNELAATLDKSTSAGSNGVAAGPLHNDLGIRQMRRQLAQLTSTVLSSQGSIRTLAEIGVATNRDGTLSLNRARLEDALAKDPAAVEGLFNPSQYSSDALVAINSPMGRVKPGTYTLTGLTPDAGSGNAAGTIDGLAATGMGAFLIAPSASAAVGLVVEVKGAVASATVTIDPGLGGALQAIRDALKARSGPLARSQESLGAEGKQIASDRTRLEARSTAYHDQLLASFTTMDRRVSAFKATQSYLEQQIKAWNSSSN
ncbi:MAG: flagellar filament capping protein FliD [Sphingomonadales bacterium]